MTKATDDTKRAYLTLMDRYGMIEPPVGVTHTYQAFDIRQDMTDDETMSDEEYAATYDRHRTGCECDECRWQWAQWADGQDEEGQ